MTEQDIAKIVEDAFDSHVEAIGWNDDGTPMADLCGRGAFLSEVEDKLKELFADNDLAK